MKIAVLTMHTHEISDYALQTLGNKFEYCERNKYKLISVGSSVVTDRPLVWSKIRLIQTYTPIYDGIVWIDADAVIVDMGMRLEQFFENDFVITRDRDSRVRADNGSVNAGVFFVKSCSWSESFLRDVYGKVGYSDPCKLRCPGCSYLHDGCEQRAIDFFCNQEENKSHVCVWKNDIFNKHSRDYDGDVLDNAFIIHPYGIQGEAKKELLEKFLGLVKR